MKNLLKVVLPILLYFNVNSCDEEFVVETEFEDAYILNCLVDATSNYNIATISRTYTVKDKYSGNDYSERLIIGAKVIIKNGREEFQLKDSVTTIVDSDGNSKDVYFYYTNELRNTLARDLTLTAVLPDGDTLKSETQVPSRIQIDYSNTAELIPPDDESDNFSVAWKDQVNEDAYYDPRLKIVYYKLVDGEYKMYNKDVPLQINKISGVNVPLYINPSFSTSVEYSMQLFDDTMEQISENDTDKSIYYIAYAEVDIYTYDQYLTGYYIGTHLLDKYSIRLDEVDYSNIEGGYGLFGSFDRITTKIAIDPRYIMSLGYEPYH